MINDFVHQDNLSMLSVSVECECREAPWSSGRSGSVMVQKVAVKREFEAGLRHAPT